MKINIFFLAVISLVFLASCGKEIKPRKTRAVSVVVNAEPIEVVVARMAAQETGIDKPWSIKKVYFGDSKVPLCNCRQGNYLVASTPTDTGRAFFSVRGEYLSSVVLIDQDKDTRKRRFKSSSGEVFDRVQQRTRYGWMTDYQEYINGDTVVRRYFGGAHGGDVDRQDQLGTLLFEVRANGSLNFISRYDERNPSEGAPNAYISTELTGPGKYRRGCFFNVNKDVFVDGELVERYGVYYDQSRQGIDLQNEDVTTYRLYLPNEKRFVETKWQ